jgi:hypothetical protein
MQQQHHASDDSLEGGGETRSYGSAMVPLPDSFSPGEYDVIVGRGKAARNWSGELVVLIECPVCSKPRFRVRKLIHYLLFRTGNAIFRDLVASRLDEYSAATSKLEKSAIVTAGKALVLGTI